jgi:hypothetical protein
MREALQLQADRGAPDSLCCFRQSAEIMYSDQGLKECQVKKRSSLIHINKAHGMLACRIFT